MVYCERFPSSPGPRSIPVNIAAVGASDRCPLPGLLPWFGESRPHPWSLIFLVTYGKRNSRLKKPNVIFPLLPKLYAAAIDRGYVVLKKLGLSVWARVYIKNSRSCSRRTFLNLQGVGGELLEPTSFLGDRHPLP